MDTFSQRRDRLNAQLTEEGIDGVLVTNPVNVTYLTGFTGDGSYLIVGRSRAIIISDGRFTTQLSEECPGLEAVIRPPGQTTSQAAAEVLQKIGVTSIGLESAHLSVAEFQNLADQAKTLTFKTSPNRVEKLRQLKDAGEIEHIRASVAIAEKAFAMFRAMLRPDDSEKELADALESYIRRAGGTCSAFPPIVAVGDRSALPHAPPTSRRLCEGSLVLVDWGATGSLYKSDLTRVLFRHNNGPSYNAEFERKLREVHGVVLTAQKRAIAAARPGTKTGDVDAAARQTIADAGYGDYFTHSTGHGFGLQIHEAPLMKPGSDIVLQPGMVVTIEPGIYVPGLGGIRIEDDICITADGCEVLTHVPRDVDACFLDF